MWQQPIISMHRRLCPTLLEAWEGGPRNTLILFDRFGERKLTYSKVHTCDFDVERHLTPGEDFYVTDLDTAAPSPGGRRRAPSPDSPPDCPQARFEAGRFSADS